jgi:predicted nucleic acid-binding protein
LALLVDSSVWIDYFNGITSPQSDYLEQSLGQIEILVGDLILAEVLQGFRRRQDFDLAREALLRFPVLEMVGAEMAIRSAENYLALRSNGITIRKTIDCLIATFCIENGLELLHSDRDFDPFEAHLDLRVVHP